MEMKNVIAREGREAKNLILYHLSSEDERANSRKPPTHIRTTVLNRKMSLSDTKSSDKSNRRVRSASTGRDKRSELQARYWALLLGNLQRAVNDIYQTVECYENLSSCQEVILVLENYTRDFRALAEWFRVSWDYEKTPLPQRPPFVAWEIRKSNPAPTTIRAKSLSNPSPNASGKSSPCPSFSGKISPCQTIDEEKLETSPRKKVLMDIKTNIALTSKPLTDGNLKSPRHNSNVKTSKTEPDTNGLSHSIENGVSNIETELTKIPEETQQCMTWGDMMQQDDEAESQETIHPPNNMIESILMFDQYSQTSGFEDEYLTLQQWRDKYESNKHIVDNTAAVSHTINKLDEMENEFLEQNANQPSNLIQTTTNLSKENALDPKKAENNVAETIKSAMAAEQSDKKLTSPEEKRVQTGTAQLKYSNVVVRPTTASIRPNNLPKATPNRLHVKPTGNVIGRPSTTTLNNTVNSNVTRKQPIKSAPIPPMNKPKVTPPKESVVVDRRTVKSTPQRSSGVPSNTASRLAARSKTMIDLNKTPTTTINDTIVKSTSRDSMGSSTSTIRASNDHIYSSQTNVRRSEPRSIPTRMEDDDGWLTVKARRRSSLHWSNRFNQPSGYTSLPNLLNEPSKEKNSNKKDNKKVIKSTPSKSVEMETRVAKGVSTNSPCVKEKLTNSLATVTPKSKSKNQTSADRSGESKVKPLNAKPLNVKETEKSATIVSRATILQRQRSDVTGLKLNNLRKEYFRIEKTKKMKENSKKINSTTKEQSNEQPKNSIDIQTTNDNKLDISPTMNELYASCMVESGESLMSNESTKRDAESDNETESDENQRKLLEEEECLERQIFELQNTEIDVEIDDAECDTILGLSEGEPNTELDEQCDDNMNLESKYQHLLSDLSTGERIQTLATLQAFVSRHPGRAQELHQKLSSPSHRSLTEILKKYQEKQERARDMRETLNKEKTLKLQALLARVEDVKIAKQKLIEEKRLRMEEKLKKYAENRNQYLKHKIRKAHDEEEKLKEIAFIKSLEAQNKRLDLMELRKEQEGRLLDLEAERQKRVEEKLAKEAAVERRRLELALERQKRLERIDETRRERELRVVSMQEEREKMRQQIARDKAREREERLLALQAQQQQTTEELQRKIIQKQQESARRHEETIEHIRQRALELSIPSRNVDDTNSNRNENSDHTMNDELSSVVSDLSIDQTKASKKKLKKLRQRISQLTDEYMKDLEPVPLYMKRDSSVPKVLAMIKKGGGPQGMERQLGQLSRTIAKAEVFDFQCFWLMDGLGALADVIKTAIEPKTELEISRKALIMAIQIYRDACSPCIQIARHAILGNSISILFDVLLHSLQTPDEKTSSHPIELSTELMLATTVVLSPFNVLKQPHPNALERYKVLQRLPDIVSYAVSIGLIDALSKRCMKIREPIESHQSVVLSVLACLGLLTKFTDVCPKDSVSSKLLSVIKSTELFGTISLLYATIVPVGESIPPRTISVAASAFNLILTIANLDLNVFQSIMSQESLSLQFFDVITILLKYCGPKTNENPETQAVIVDLVATLGFLCANNKQNQNLLISDQSSVIIKSLSKLPKSFDIVVYPTLLCLTCDNDGAKNVIGKEFDLKLIEDYEKSETGKKNKMLTMLHSNTKENNKSNK